MRQGEGAKSLGGVIRTLFARRDDPYAGNDVDNARRLTGLSWLIYGVALAILLPIAPPTGESATAATVVAIAIVVHSLLRGYRWVTRTGAGFNALLAGGYIAVAQLVLLQALAGDNASAYQELYLLVAVVTAAVHPPRRVAPFLAAVAIAATMPVVYQGWSSTAAADLGVSLLLWFGLSALSMILLATLRAQRQALQAESKHAQELAHQDPLTGIGNRRRLMADLNALLPLASEETPLLLAAFDLDGFKAYNDTYGHPTGDTLLRRLGSQLARAMQARGHVYRMGGDEFCVLAHVTPADAPTVVERAAGALSASGDLFEVKCSYGWVMLPHEEVVDSSTALRIADRRMYAQKNLSRSSAGRQATDALLQVLSERSADLGSHMHDVTALCDAVAALVGVPAESRGPLLQAASLHDIGKAAIPDSILDKPGPLNADEWTFMRTHTVIGERIMAAAPALKEAAQLVRASHERFDGSGYPDGLSGEEIPLGARIIAVCDAYDAMVSKRPYRSRMSPEVAVEEIRRCAGTQFDPRVVDAFCTALGERTRDTALG
jgi:diguanylate cyclase (GGDEF)-like protein